MRRSERQIADTGQMHDIIQASPFMRLALCRENQPYVLPLSFGFDGIDLFFHCADQGRKIDILQHNPRVCCLFEQGLTLKTVRSNPCAWGVAYATVIVQGVASQITDEATKLTALQCITDHYASNAPRVPADKIGHVAVWKITIEEMTGKRSA